MTLARVHADDLSGRLEATMRDMQLRREQALDLHRRIAARYAELAGDATVRKALEAIGRTGTATVSLGPSRDPSDALRRIEAVPRRTANPTPATTSTLELQGVSRLRGLVGAADLLLHDVAVAAGRLATIERERNSRRKLLADQLLEDRKPSEVPRKNGTAEIRNARIRTDRLLSEQDHARIVSREILDQLAADQDEFLRLIAAARGLIDEMARPDIGSDSGPGTRKSNPAPASHRRPSQDPSIQPYSRRLDDLEKIVRSERIAVDVDKGLIWIDATIEGSNRLKMIPEPRIEGLRLASATAIELGVRPIDAEPAVEVETLDGRMLPARRARLDSVQVGPYVLHDVECLVLPKEFGVSPPLLGGRLLGRLTPKVDTNLGTMTLTQLNVKPILRAQIRAADPAIAYEPDAPASEWRIPAGIHSLARRARIPSRRPFIQARRASE